MPVRAVEFVTLDTSIRCTRLRATLSARVCILRQSCAARGRTRQRSRGQGPLFPSCDGCPEGLALFEVVPGADAITWRGRGPGGRFERGAEGGARNFAAQCAAREQQERVGLLEPVPTCDDEPVEVDDAEAVAVAF